MDGGAWWAAIYGVAQSRTRLKRFSSSSTGIRSVKETPCHAGDRNGNPLQCSCLGNPTNRGAWWATIHRVTKGQTQLSMQAQVQFFWREHYLTYYNE